MAIFTFRSATGEIVEVSAPTEHLARREAMIKLWGDKQSPAVPHAPNYYGTGLSFISRRPE